MRSRSCAKGFIKQEENELPKRRMKVQEEKEVKDGKTAACGTAKKPARASESGKKTTTDLTNEDLLHLLGIMEGEVQAREDIISLLKSDRTKPESLEAHYGSSAPTKPLQALQRDGLVALGNKNHEDVYEKPMAELDRLEEKQKETYRRMLEQLLLAEKCHRRTVMELDNEKRKHADFMTKSDDFTNLLEQERERLKRLLEQEKAYQARKDKEHSRRLEKLRAELVKLKSFALMLVDERQLHIDQIDQQNQKIQEFTQKLQEKELRLAEVTDSAKEDGQKILKMEAELEHRAAKFAQEHEEMANKMAAEESQSRQLRLKLVGLSNKMEELQESNKELRKSEEDLQELREKIRKGECGNSSLVAELENLRKKVMEMEGKDEEIIKTETQCRDLRKKLQDEENHGKELRLEVDKVQKRMVELEKLEGAFNRSKTECSQLHLNLEKEKRAVRGLSGELETLKNRLKELEGEESKLEKAEMILRDDLMKLKSFTVILVDERKNMAERLKQEEQKSDELSKMFKTEQGKVTEVTEKLIEESKRLLKFKSEMEVKATELVKERDALKSKLLSEEEKCKELNVKIKGMEARMDGLEEREMERKWENDRNTEEEDNKVKELTVEIERLKNRLKQLEVVEGDLMKTEDEYDLLEQKFRTEQEKASALSKLLEEVKSQIARKKAIEKGEAQSPENELRIRCKMEEAKSRELQVDVEALKEKIHELMNKEDQRSQIQVDYSVLQQRFVEEEQKKKSLRQEVADLTAELEATKRFSRSLRPNLNGKRMINFSVTSTAVQTDKMAAVAGDDDDDETAAGFIRKSVLEENHLMSNLRERTVKKPAVLERYPPAAADLEDRKSWIPWMKKKAAAMTVSQSSPEAKKTGKPLHIRVTPDHRNSTATLEITSPPAEDFFSSTAIFPTLGLQKPRITIVPKTCVASKGKPCESPAAGLHRAKSPVTIATKSDGPEVLPSPVSITVSTTPVSEACAAPEPHKIPPAGARAVIKVAPERHAGPPPPPPAAPPPFRKYGGKSNIVTTEDNKIHIHLGPQFARTPEAEAKEEEEAETTAAGTGTVLRSPRQPATGRTGLAKMTSSITITPVTMTTARPSQTALGSDVPSSRGAATRIPVSKGVKSSGKATFGVSTVTRMESRAESHSMKIELRKSAVSAATGGKS